MAEAKNEYNKGIIKEEEKKTSFKLKGPCLGDRLDKIVAIT